MRVRGNVTRERVREWVQHLKLSRINSGRFSLTELQLVVEKERGWRKRYRNSVVLRVVVEKKVVI